MGVTIRHYSSDNGVFRAEEFGRSLKEKGQTIRHSGVGGHHQNGPAENSIKNVSRRARIMMFHAALRWPDVSDKTMWPFAIRHAVHLHNHMPSSVTGLSPIEIWTQSKATCNPLISVHPWGCPVHVLSPKLQDGQKIPRWAPRSRLAPS